MSVHLIVAGAVIIGILIGWLLATEVNRVLWRMLIKIQRQTASSQRYAINLAENTNAFSKELKEKDLLIKKELEEAVAIHREALATAKRTNAELEEAWREVNAE